MSSKSTISVIKKPLKKQSFKIPGTHPSIYNSLLLTSTGVPSFDSILGGGLPIGSVLLIEEDINKRFSTILSKYFLAEGVASKHDICVIKENIDQVSLFSDLPKLIPKDIEVKSKKKEEMKIAFRYQGNYSATQKSISNISKHNHYYDITSKMDSIMLDSCDKSEIILEDFIPSCWEEEDLFRFTLTALKDKLTKYSVPDKIEEDTKLNVMRIVIPSFGSPFWCSNNTANVYRMSRFLYCLRGVIRNKLAVCYITLPSHLYSESNCKIITQSCDCSIKLKSFAGEKSNPLFKQYHGLFEIKKLPCLNSLHPYIPQSLDLAFELKRTKFVIENLHLPADISETASRSSGGCGSKSLEF